MRQASGKSYRVERGDVTQVTHVRPEHSLRLQLIAIKQTIDRVSADMFEAQERLKDAERCVNACKANLAALRSTGAQLEKKLRSKTS